MLRLLRKLMGPSAAAPGRSGPHVSKSATSDILSKAARSRGAPAPGGSGPISKSAQEFDPYNSGAFNRSASWERIGKRKL